jgi:hypothetical protein
VVAVKTFKKNRIRCQTAMRRSRRSRMKMEVPKKDTKSETDGAVKTKERVSTMRLVRPDVPTCEYMQSTEY